MNESKSNQNKSESIIEIAKALSIFQSKCPVLEKGKQGYGYKYTDLPSIVHTINPILKDCGLCFTQLTGSHEDHVSVTTILIHSKSGEFFQSTISSKAEAKGKTSLIQNTGAIITYLRRYSLSSILGIVSDEDIDGYVEKPSIDALLEEVKLCTTRKQLKDVWDSYPDFRGNTEFSNLVTLKNKSFDSNS